MKSSALFCRRFANWLGGAAVALSLSVAAYAQQPLTPRSVVAGLDKLKQTYEVKNFKIGGKYDLANPKSFEFGAEGGKTLESLGAAPAKTAYIAVGTPKNGANTCAASPGF